MQFMVTYAFTPDQRNSSQDRFGKTGGLPGPGVKMLGRWHSFGGNRGFILADTSDGVALGKWLNEWTDLLTFEVFPVHSDEDVMKIIGG